MVTGGTEAPITRMGVAGFQANKALTTSDDPNKASRPYSKDRDGFVIGEGAGIVMLEELEHAKARGAKIYGEVVGYGTTGDAHHITAPAEEGEGGARAMIEAMKDAASTLMRSATSMDTAQVPSTMTCLKRLPSAMYSRTMPTICSSTPQNR